VFSIPRGDSQVVVVDILSLRRLILSMD